MSNKNQPKVEGMHEVGWKDSAPAPKDEVITSEGSANQAEQVLGSTIWVATAVLISFMLFA